MKFLPSLVLLFSLAFMVGFGWPIARHNFGVAVAYWTGGAEP